MSRLDAALAYVPQGVICMGCKVRKPPAEYGPRSPYCRACRHQRHVANKIATHRRRITP